MGSFFYASNNSLLTLWNFEHGVSYDEYMVIVVAIGLISLLTIKNICSCLYAMDA